MTAKRHAEIAGAGFAGLVAAVALAQRGWSVRVHERTPALRAEGFAIAMQPNMLRVLLADGRRLAADLVIGADGVNSALRDSLGLVSQRTVHNDGAMRTLISRTPDDAAEDATLGPRTCEYWSGTRRVITSPCSSRELYVARSCLAEDAAGRAVPIDSRAWAKSFPQLTALFERIAAETDWSRVRWSRFETIRLKRWHAGRVAVLGDAAHSMSPNLARARAAP